MKKSITPRFFAQSSLSLTLALAVLGALSACGFEVENPENPAPISPSKRTGTDTGRSPDSAQNDTQPARSVPEPTQTCTVQVAVGETNSSGQQGAVVALPETAEYENAALVLRVFTTGSFIEIRDQVFIPTGTFSPGAYVFELQRADGQSCKVPLLITSEHVTNKVKLTLTVQMPQ